MSGVQVPSDVMFKDVCVREIGTRALHSSATVNLTIYWNEYSLGTHFDFDWENEVEKKCKA